MKIMRFGKHENEEAVAHAKSGGVALHVYEPSHELRSRKTTPRAFKRNRLWAHLFDLNKERLMKLAKKLGVRRIYIHHEGTNRQHVDLCGSPLIRAIDMSLVAERR